MEAQVVFYWIKPNHTVCVAKVPKIAEHFQKQKKVKLA